MNIKKLLFCLIIVSMISSSFSHAMCTESDPNIYNNPEAFFRVFERMYSYFFNKNHVIQNTNSYEALSVFITKRMP